MSMSADHKSKFEAVHRQQKHLHMSKKFSSGMPKQKKIIYIEENVMLYVQIQ